jgi:hypothetical protein
VGLIKPAARQNGRLEKRTLRTRVGTGDYLRFDTAKTLSGRNRGYRREALGAERIANGES